MPCRGEGKRSWKEFALEFSNISRHEKLTVLALRALEELREAAPEAAMPCAKGLKIAGGERISEHSAIAGIGGRVAFAEFCRAHFHFGT
jgi:hypothetical protein